MQLKTIYKIITIIISVLIVLTPVKCKCLTINEIDNKADGFINDGANSSARDDAIGVDPGLIKSFVNDIYNLLLALGIFISVIVGAIIGIKFIIGSVEEKAKNKELIVPYILGCTVIFGAFGIWKILIEVFGKI